MSEKLLDLRKLFLAVEENINKPKPKKPSRPRAGDLPKKTLAVPRTKAVAVYCVIHEQVCSNCGQKAHYASHELLVEFESLRRDENGKPKFTWKQGRPLALISPYLPRKTLFREPVFVPACSSCWREENENQLSLFS